MSPIVPRLIMEILDIVFCKEDLNSPSRSKYTQCPTIIFNVLRVLLLIIEKFSLIVNVQTIRNNLFHIPIPPNKCFFSETFCDISVGITWMLLLCLLQTQYWFSNKLS